MGCIVAALFCQDRCCSVASGLRFVAVAVQGCAGCRLPAALSFSVQLLGQASCASRSQACSCSLGAGPFPNGCGAGEGSCCWDVLSVKAGMMPLLVLDVLCCRPERRSVCPRCALWLDESRLELSACLSAPRSLSVGRSSVPGVPCPRPEPGCDTVILSDSFQLSLLLF